MGPRTFWELFKAAAAGWWESNAPRLGAALSYYTLFSLAPVLIVVIAIAGAVFGEEAARGEVVAQIDGLLGPDGARAVQAILEQARRPGEGGVFATVVGVLTFFLGATGAFLELHGAINTIWKVKSRDGGMLLTLLRERLVSFGMVVGLGFLLLVSLVVSTALAALGGVLLDVAPSLGLLMRVVNLVISFAVITALFAMIFRLLPDAKLAWRDVWVGAAFTAALFTVGKFLIGLYLGQSEVGSTYGAAGSVIVLLVWVYYSSLIVLFGAEFTQAYSTRIGSNALRQESAATHGL